ncbi:MAG: 2-dehydropantoate 2-reductase N-terminal domain-containing protein, partial [Candidatus Rokuibacteriota bacterium]
MKLAVLGGGNGCLTTAADMALAGHRVRLWRRSEVDLQPLRDGITLASEQRQGNARLDLVTADLAAALDGAEVVIAPLPATTHEDLAKRLTPHLRDWQVVLLTPGTLGAYAMAREIARAGGTLPYAFAEAGTLPYLCRKTG